MVYQIKFQTKEDAANPHVNCTDSFFAESESKPDLGSVQPLVEKFSGGDFADEAIHIQECPYLDAEELRKKSIVYKLGQ